MHIYKHTSGRTATEEEALNANGALRDGYGVSKPVTLMDAAMAPAMTVDEAFSITGEGTSKIAHVMADIESGDASRIREGAENAMRLSGAHAASAANLHLSARERAAHSVVSDHYRGMATAITGGDAGARDAMLADMANAGRRT